MFSLFFNFQNIRYTMYFGFLFFFLKKRNTEIQQLTLKEESEEQPLLPSNTSHQYDWGQFVEIDCY